LGLTADDPLAGLDGWLAAGRVDAAAAQRARQRWLERQAAEEATLSGVLMDLAERGRAVTVHDSLGHSTRGPVVALGADFVIVREPRLGDVVIPLEAVATVRAAPGESSVVGDRVVTLELVFAHALTELATQRPTVLISTAGEEFRGELRSVGVDVVSVAIESEHRDVIHVAMAAINHLVLLAR